MIQIVELAWKIDITNVPHVLKKDIETYEHDEESNEYIKSPKTQTTKDKDLNNWNDILYKISLKKMEQEEQIKSQNK